MDQTVLNLVDYFNRFSTWTVITGAGISASSGIPTYRDQNGKWLGSDPIQHRDFIAHDAKRRRYWARSTVGWPPVAQAKPNDAHHAITRLQAMGLAGTIITQNVDRLHQRAGSANVIDLHGRLDRVQCLDCGQRFPRHSVQDALTALNPDFPAILTQVRPDGDADIPDDLVDRFNYPSCHQCAGTLMPEVVFFGGTVKPDVVAACNHAIETSEAVLIVGSSLQVFSGFRFARLASRLNKPLVILNDGITRADDIATFKVASNAMNTLIAAVDQLQHAQGFVHNE